MFMEEHLKALLTGLSIAVVSALILSGLSVADEGADPANGELTNRITKDTLSEEPEFEHRWTEWLANYVKEYGKIKDPYHPRFIPDKFRFEDYSASNCMMMEAMAKLFPRGTPKRFVDFVLVAAGDASAESLEHGKYSYFIELQPTDSPLVFKTSTWNVIVQYTTENKVAGVSLRDKSVYEFFENCKFGQNYGKKWGIE